MIELGARTEFSFREAYGTTRAVVGTANKAIGIADVGVWGHTEFREACAGAGVKPILGARVSGFPEFPAPGRSPPGVACSLF